MLSEETIKLSCDLLINLAKSEKKVEINRQVLGGDLEFDAYQVFSYLDTESKNYINEVNIINFLQKRNGIPCTIEEIEFLIFLYDENFDAKLSYMEFLNLVLSDNNFSLRKNARERVGSCYGNSVLPFSVEYGMVKLLQKELELIRSTWTIIAELKSRNDFNVHDLFHYMKGYGCITSQSLKLFLQRNFVEFNDEDIRLIIKRMDLNKDSKVNFCEFHALLCFPNLKCTCCSYCNNNCQNNNRNDNSYYDENSSYISKVNSQLSKAINDSMNIDNRNNNFNDNIEDYSYNQKPKSRLNLRLSPERTNKINKIERAKSTNNLKVSTSNISDVYSDQDTAFLSPSLQLIPQVKRKFSPNANVRNTNTYTNANINRTQNNYNPNLNPKNRTMTQFYTPKINNYNNNNNNPIFKTTNNTVNNFYKNNCMSIYEKRNRCEYCNSYPCHCNELEFKEGETNFLKYIYNVIQLESKIEEAKIGLIMRSDFNTEDAFRIFENPESENISFTDLQKALKQLGIYTSLKEVKLLMRRVDIKNKGYIDYPDFFDLLVPFQKKYRDNVERRIPSSFMPSYNKSDIFLLTTKIYLTNLIRLIISCEDQLNILRENIIGVNTQIEKIFKKMDHTGLGYITDIELINYLRDSGIKCNDLQSGLTFIRFDKNRDGKIQIWEIEEELTPS